MFNGEYNPVAIQEAQRARKALALKCQDCAEVFGHYLYKDLAPKITTRAKLIQFLDWQFEIIGHEGIGKIEWIEDVLASYGIKFKRGIV